MNRKKAAKELLGESLEELLQVKPLEKITVNEIAENCGVGRRTFYTHFIDKYDLATWLYVRYINSFFEGDDVKTLSDFLKYTILKVNSNLQILIELDKYNGQNSFRRSLEEPFAEAYIRVIEEYHHHQVDNELKNDIQFFVGGQINYVARQIKEPVIPEPEEAYNLFVRCMPESIKQYI